MKNLEVRSIIEETKFKRYEIAAVMGMAETSFSRMFRKELTPEQVTRIKNAIKELKEAK